MFREVNVTYNRRITIVMVNYRTIDFSIVLLNGSSASILRYKCLLNFVKSREADPGILEKFFPL